MKKTLIIPAFLFLLITSLQAQKLTITGTVTDKDGIGLPGVNLIEKGTNHGSITDSQGRYSVTVSDSSATIIYSYVGYLDEHLQVGSQTKIDVKLIEDFMRLDDVVVIGYGTAKKSDLTGAIESVKPKDLNSSGISNAAQMLQGRITGLYINSHDQNPGATPDFVLRGASSFQSGEAGQPLIVIDGFPMEKTSSVNTINPNDIEQIDVLKDASATAIYGSRGANGVIIITTKQGNQKGLQVDYSSRFFTQSQARKIDVMSGQEYTRFYYDLAHDPNLQVGTWGPENGYPHHFTAWDTLSNTNWQNEVLNTNNFSQEHNLSLSGVREGVRYRAAANYFDAKGIVAPSGYQRMNALTRLDYDFKKFSFNLDFNFTNEQRNRSTNSYERAVGFSPSTPAYDNEGELSQHAFESIRSWFYNPLFPGQAEEDFTETNTTRIAGGMSYEIVPGLRASIKGGINQINEEEFYQRFEPFYESETETAASLSSYSNRQIYSDFFLNYSKQLGNHKLSAMAGGTFQNYRRRGLWSSAMDYPYPNIGYFNIDAGLLEREMGSSWYEKRQVSGLARFNYDYKGKYLLTMNYRLDGATVFGDNSKWGHFPSFGVAYRIDQEDFFKDMVPFLSALKIKAGYGIAGNANIPSFRTQNLIDFNPVHEGDGVTNGILWVSPVNREEDSQRTTYLPNPDLHWETTYTFNSGIELGSELFYAEFNYYHTNHDELILDRQVPAETGFNYITVNKGAMTNQGIEGKIDFFLNFLNRDLQWRPGILLSYNKNEITDLDDDKILGFGVWIDRTLYGYAGIKQEGYPLNAVWGYDFIGIWQEDEIDEAALYGAEPGDPKFADINGLDEEGNQVEGSDGQITEEDKQFLGDANPEFTAGLNNQINYKKFELSFFVEGIFNKTVINSSKATLVYPSYNYGTNKMRLALDRWSATNPSNEVPSLTKSLPENLIMSDWAIEDATFIRLRDITLTYKLDFPESTKIKNLHIYASVANLLTFTKYTGINPDVWGIDDMEIDFNNNSSDDMMPFSRTYTIGLRASF